VSKLPFFLRFALGALRYRKQRLLAAFAALAVAAALATILFAIYGSVEQRIRNEFRAYGANISAVPLHGTTIPLKIAEAAEALGAEAAPFLVTAGKVGNRTIPIAGFIPDKTARLTTYWQIQGQRAVTPGECVAGERLASDLNAAIGATIALAGAPCKLTGILATGGAEDDELLVPLPVAAQLSGISAAASVVQIRADGNRVESVRAALATQFPEADIRTVRSVAGTETSVVLKIRAALFLLTALILAITTLCVSSNFTEMVVERAKEIGIMKALGAAEGRLAAFFLSESTALALAGSIMGYLLGLLGAGAIGREIFGAGFERGPGWVVFLSVTAVMLLVAAIATAIAASRIRAIQPAVILRGE
jgi:putative ABC transport system permease protein